MADTNKKNKFLDYAGLSLFWSNVKNVIESNELVTATALTNLDTRVNTVEDLLSNQIISISYTDLKSLRDNAQLVPGQQYRITDYKCTTVQENTRAANHQFDIIVTADDASTINEVARAVKHDGDTYFANNDLSAWKIWYCLDNDATRFAWADSSNGKGVIYRMIDEFNNDIPYDFKNIQFKHPIDTTTYPHYYYTFASDNVEDNTDCSLDIANSCRSNTIKNTQLMEDINEHPMILNQIIFIGICCFGNSFGNDCNSNSFGGWCFYNTFGDGCSDNTFGSGFGGNTFGDGCSNNTFGPSCQNNTFGSGCYNNSFGSNCSNNSFGSNCSNIKFASDSSVTIKYNYYQYNHFGDGCKYILFKGTETASSTTQVQNYNFAQGLQGTSSAYLTVDGVRNLSYEATVAKNSSGELKIYCEADLIK